MLPKFFTVSQFMTHNNLPYRAANATATKAAKKWLQENGYGLTRPMRVDGVHSRFWTDWETLRKLREDKDQGAIPTTWKAPTED